MSNVTIAAPRRLRVFLCHASGDKPAVRGLYQRLLNDEFQPWLDEEDLLPGQRWQDEIPRAVRSADVVLVCLSPRSVGKEGYVQKEIKFALDVADEKPEGTIFLIPLRLEDCAVPERLSPWHWVDYWLPKGYERLLRALRARAASLMPLPVETPELQAGTVSLNPQDGLQYVWIPAGEFLMGAVPGDRVAFANENPRHSVLITKGFWLGKTPVTVAAYKRFIRATGRTMPTPPDFNPGWEKDDHPIVRVDWDDASAFSAWAGGRLPTEAEWEYAARGGKEGLVYPWGDEIGPERANYGSSHAGTTPVTRFPPQNDWGLHDMAGNVWEWLSDWYGEYSGEKLTNPTGPKGGTLRVLRGGAWDDSAGDLRAAVRLWYEPVYRDYDVGFRVAREVPFP